MHSILIGAEGEEEKLTLCDPYVVMQLQDPAKDAAVRPTASYVDVHATIILIVPARHPTRVERKGRIGCMSLARSTRSRKKVEDKRADD